MFQIRRDDDCILDTLTENVEQRLQINKKNIGCMNNEIFEAKDILIHLHKILDKQKDGLINSLQELKDLEKELDECPLNTIVLNENVHNGQSFSDTSSERIVKENSCERVVLKRINSETFDSDEDLNGKIVVRNDENIINATESSSMCLKEYIPLNQLEIPQLANKTVSKMLLTNGFIIGGSGGLLLKYTDNEAHIYETNTECNITHVEISNRNRTASVVAFTNENIFIFNLEGRRPYHVVDLLALYITGVESVVNNGTLIYMSLSNGLVKTLDKDWTINDHHESGRTNIRAFFPSTFVCKYTLVTLQDSLLYQTSSEKDLDHLKVVEGPTGVKNVLRVNKQNFICYSDDTIWLLDSECEIMDTVLFKFGIKFVERDAVSVVVADWNNSVHLHSLKNDSFGLEIYVKDIAVSITALAINTYHVYVAAGDCVFVIYYEF